MIRLKLVAAVPSKLRELTMSLLFQRQRHHPNHGFQNTATLLASPPDPVMGISATNFV